MPVIRKEQTKRKGKYEKKLSFFTTGAGTHNNCCMLCDRNERKMSKIPVLDSLILKVRQKLQPK